MEPIDLILKIWGIASEDRTEVENILKNTSPQHLGLSLANMAVCTDDTAAETNEQWMKTHLPELRFV